MSLKPRVVEQGLDKEVIELQAERAIKNQLAAAGDRINELATELEQILRALYKAGIEVNHRFEAKTPYSHAVAADLTVPAFRTEGDGSSIVNRPVDFRQEAPPLATLVGSGLDTSQQQGIAAAEVEIAQIYNQLARAEFRLSADASTRVEGELDSLSRVVKEKQNQLKEARVRLDKLKNGG